MGEVESAIGGSSTNMSFRHMLEKANRLPYLGFSTRTGLSGSKLLFVFKVTKSTFPKAKFRAKSGSTFSPQNGSCFASRPSW